MINAINNEILIDSCEFEEECIKMYVFVTADGKVSMKYVFHILNPILVAGDL